MNSLMRHPQRQIGVVEPASNEETTPLPDTALGDELAVSAPKLRAGSCPGGRVRLPRLGLCGDRRLRVTGARCGGSCRSEKMPQRRRRPAPPRVSSGPQPSASGPQPSAQEGPVKRVAHLVLIVSVRARRRRRKSRARSPAGGQADGDRAIALPGTHSGGLHGVGVRGPLAPAPPHARRAPLSCWRGFHERL